MKPYFSYNSNLELVQFHDSSREAQAALLESMEENRGAENWMEPIDSDSCHGVILGSAVLRDGKVCLSDELLLGDAPAPVEEERVAGPVQLSMAKLITGEQSPPGGKLDDRMVMALYRTLTAFRGICDAVDLNVEATEISVTAGKVASSLKLSEIFESGEKILKEFVAAKPKAGEG